MALAQWPDLPTFFNVTLQVPCDKGGRVHIRINGFPSKKMAFQDPIAVGPLQLAQVVPVQ